MLGASGSLTASPADVRLIENAHFIDESVDGPYDCGGLTTAVDEGTVRVHVLGNRRGSSPFPFYVENVNGTVVTTNLEKGGTITVTVHAQGIVRYYDQFGRFVLKDPGALWFSFVLDYNGTPGDPSDDTEVEGAFQIVRPSTGNSNLPDRDFCADLATFTSAPWPMGRAPRMHRPGRSPDERTSPSVSGRRR